MQDPGEINSNSLAVPENEGGNGEDNQMVECYMCFSNFKEDASRKSKKVYGLGKQNVKAASRKTGGEIPMLEEEEDEHLQFCPKCYDCAVFMGERAEDLRSVENFSYMAVKTVPRPAGDQDEDEDEYGESEQCLENLEELLYHDDEVVEEEEEYAVPPDCRAKPVLKRMRFQQNDTILVVPEYSKSSSNSSRAVKTIWTMNASGRFKCSNLHSCGSLSVPRPAGDQDEDGEREQCLENVAELLCNDDEVVEEEDEYPVSPDCRAKPILKRMRLQQNDTILVVPEYSKSSSNSSRAVKTTIWTRNASGRFKCSNLHSCGSPRSPQLIPLIERLKISSHTHKASSSV